MKFIIFLIFLVFNCIQEGKDYKKNYETTAILLYLTKAPPNPQAKCEESAKVAGSCLFQASDKPLLPAFITEEYYASNLIGSTPAGGTDSYKNYCETSLKSESLKDWSESARECLFGCQKAYWDTVVRLEDCPKKTTEALLKGQGPGTTVCITKCFRVTNN